MEANLYLPTVAWRTEVNSVIILSDATLLAPATYRVTVSPVDINEVAGLASIDIKKVGYYLKDYVGATYTIIGIDTNTVDISDDFRTGRGPQEGRWGIVFKSVGEGSAPYLAPVYYRHLDKSALDYSRRFELDILWRHINSEVSEILIGVVDGVNRIFTTTFPYKTGSLKVFLNGLKTNEFIEYSSSSIQMDEAPKITGFTDILEVIYNKKL